MSFEVATNTVWNVCKDLECDYRGIGKVMFTKFLEMFSSLYPESVHRPLVLYIKKSNVFYDAAVTLYKKMGFVAVANGCVQCQQLRMVRAFPVA